MTAFREDVPGVVDGRTPAEIHHGQVKYAYLLAERNADKLLHVFGIGWHYWDGRRWAHDDRGEAKRAVLDMLRGELAASLGNKDARKEIARVENATGIAGILTIASALETFAATVADLDADPWLLNVANGTLDLRTLELLPHSPADRITKVCAAAYDPGAAGSTWQAFLERVLPDTDVREFLQRLAGVALIGKVMEHVLPIGVGEGANGKGVWYGACLHALGDYASTVEPELLMHRQGAHPTGEMDLRGLRFAVLTETEQDRRLSESTAKRLTGGDPIKARYMRQDFVRFDPSHSIFMVTNHLPTVSDDPALWRRLVVVPFDVTIPEGERDGNLGDTLQAEAEAVLAWMVAGLKAYQRLGNKLDAPEAVRVRTNEYHADSDAVKQFIDEMCVTGPAYGATTQELFTAWDGWRVSAGVPQVSRKAFGQALDRRGYPATGRTANARRRPGIMLAKRDDETGY